MKNIFFLLSLSMGLFVFISCDKDDDEVTDTNIDYQYSVQINSPDTEDKHLNDTISINVEFESMANLAVHHINVSIYNASDSTQVYSKPDVAHIHSEGGKHVFEDMLVLSEENGFSPHSDWIFEAKVWSDEEGDDLDEVSATINFHVHPE